MTRGVGVALALLLAAGSSAARELPSFFRGVRPLGMGGAFTAVADDENAIFYNAAGLDKVERWRMAILNPLVEVNEDGVGFYQDARDTDLNDTSDVTQLLREHIGDYLHVQGALFPFWYARHFGAGLLAAAKINAQANNPAFPELQVYDAGYSVSGHFGTGWGFFDGALRVGGAVKLINANTMKDRVYTAADIAGDFEDELKDDMKQGSGFGFDVGAMLELPILLKPTLAVAVQNIGDVDLGDAGAIPQQVNVGVSLSHAFSWVTLTAAADYLDVTKNTGNDNDSYKRLHMGIEGKMWGMFSLRAGLNEGYSAFGAAIDLKGFRLDYANYAEEIGSSAGDRSDRRNVVQVTFGW